MGSIIGRSRKDSSKAFIAQIVQRKRAPSRIPRRKLSTANAWMVNREAEKADICRAKRHVALPPKADMCSAQAHVCFAPIMHICVSITQQFLKADYAVLFSLPY